MLSLPESTEFNRRVPKQKFYENITVSPELKRIFIEQIKIIYWRNKIASTTLNLSQGKDVTEIEVLEIHLNQQYLDERVLRQIDKYIPYHILFLLKFNNKYQVWIGYKEAVSNNVAFKVSNYYHTEWLEIEDIKLKIEGLTTDDVYDGFVRQIAGSRLENKNSISLKDSIELDLKRQQLRKQIATLENKIRKEKQFNIQVKLNDELKKLKRELEDINNG